MLTNTIIKGVYIMDIKQILIHFSTISGIPLSYSDHEMKPFSYPESEYLSKISRQLPVLELSNVKKVACILTDDMLCYGRIYIESKNSYVLMGPVASLICDNRKAQRILKKYELPTTDTGSLLSYLNSIPLYSITKFTNFAIFMNYVLNHETLEIRDLLPEEYTISKENSPTPFTIGQYHVVHNSQQYEQQLYMMIRYGQHKKMLHFIKESPFTGNEGTLAVSQIRHQKNLVICSVTLASRYAAEGGIGFEESMNIADAYIQKVELAPDLSALSILHKNMLICFTKMVSDKMINNAEQGLTVKVRNYVEQHLSERITGDEIANQLNLSRTYLSTQFKNETGTNLIDFINHLKINEAKLLLLTSDQSVSSIASKLTFSSQSYFQVIFKRYTGMTPKEFRTTNLSLVPLVK